MVKCRIWKENGRWHGKCACGNLWSAQGDREGWDFVSLVLRAHMNIYGHPISIFRIPIEW